MNQAPDYLQEELKVLPPKASVDSVHSETQTLQNDVEQAASRVAALEEQIKSKKS